MIPIGRTYLIECDPPESITNEGGIFVVNEVDKMKDGFWKGKVKAYGTLFNWFRSHHGCEEECRH